MEIKLSIKSKALTLKQKEEILQKVEEIRQIVKKETAPKPKKIIPITLDELLYCNI